MIKLNSHYKKLISSYLFSKIESKVQDLKKKMPKRSLIDLGIGDITKPLSPSITQALIEASKELGDKYTMRGYGPSQGFDFLRSIIARSDYKDLSISAEEIFISNGAKTDLANLQNLFCHSSTVAITDPTYPVYQDSNVMAGRTGDFAEGRYRNIVYLPCNLKNKFIPDLPDQPCDLIYLCSPNNPTGVALTYKELEKWVDYAVINGSIIIFDGAYEAFISSKDVPHSIYEIEKAKKVAIEVKSFSKKAGFTSLRCSYSVIPQELEVDGVKLKDYWMRHQQTTFGGVPYPIQKAAEAIYLEPGKQEIATLISGYKKQTGVLREGLIQLGFNVFGGVDSPYVWCQSSKSSWEFFDTLLNEHQIISIPGEGFGHAGRGYVRFSGFAPLDQVEEALHRMSLCVTL